MNETAADLSQARIGQLAIVVHDIEKAIAFYRDALGLRFLFQAGQMGFFDCGGVRLMLSLPEKAEFDHPCSIIYFKVDDIEATYATLEGRGVKFRDAPHFLAKMPDHDLWMAFFRDMEDNFLALMCEKKR